jgi:hypothetical protein
MLVGITLKSSSEVVPVASLSISKAGRLAALSLAKEKGTGGNF